MQRLELGVTYQGNCREEDEKRGCEIGQLDGPRTELLGEGTGDDAVHVEDMAEINSATGNQAHVEKDVLAAGRASCYKARDAFFNCVEADSGHTTPTEVASVGLLNPSQCKPARAFYEENCRSTWVEHFDRQYSAKKRVKRLLDAGDRARGPITLPSNKVGLQPGE